MKRAIHVVVATALAVGADVAPRAVELHSNTWLSPASVSYWSHEAQRAIVPPIGNKFPGDAAVYMGIVHAAMYDTALAFEGGFRPYAVTATAPANASPDAAIAAAAHGVLVCLLPSQQADLDTRYGDYLGTIQDVAAMEAGVTVGEYVADIVCEMRRNDGREANPVYVQPAPGPGVFEPDPARPLLGLRLSQLRPIALDAPSQFRPDGPNALTSDEYAADFEQVKELGRIDSTRRTEDQKTQALFWTDHDLRQWNEAMLRIADAQGLDFIQTARMLALAHVSGGDAMIACFDAKFHYMAWRPYVAIPRADTDGNPATVADPTWLPLRPTPNFPEYPSAHACDTSAVAEALQTFFGTDKVSFWLDSRVTNTVRQYGGFREAVKDVNEARVLAGFHFRNSDQQGSNLGRAVARFVSGHFFQPLE